MRLRDIFILEKEPNKKGDLFGRLMADLFHSLGYDEPRLSIHKSGREIDLSAFHRIEPRMAIAECKAHSEEIGGSDINKFVGVLDAEKRKYKKDKNIKVSNFTGYFISLSGFTQSAIEQENEFDNKRIVLLKPDQIIEELINGKILVSIHKAVSAIVISDPSIVIVDDIDLLAYEKGWVWVIYYSNSSGQKVTHLAFVHAEGKPLIKELSDEIILKDSKTTKRFKGLQVINNEESSSSFQKKLEITKSKYYQYLENELGEIQFEGLPADKEVGSVKVKLENIFVPLHLVKIENQKLLRATHESAEREGIGNILSNQSRLAILAKPGGGKSTLIKRIAIAYAFPNRRKQINDQLPDKPWFPIFLRCRELGEKVTLSITEIINSISSRAEIQSCAPEFSLLISQFLQNGHALILIDGLDEITEDRLRISFVNQLRTFLATYPTINIIVTSREAGFRVVGGSLATYCEHYKVSELIESEIEELTIKWHKSIIDDSDNTIKEAKKISEFIINDTRIRVLASNPLLLTTLLFVKRWAGYLPTKRTVLYQEMIKLLLVTWNVLGHEQLDIEESEPQLAYVAYWMTKNGQQNITEQDLKNCLIEARSQMPEILGYTNISPSEFIKRVELRSSLLIMSGHTRLNTGSITALYEFLHLSFQEYLTAKAIIKKYIPQSDIQNNVTDILKPNIDNENWREVIPLAAVLLERDTKDLIEFLIEESQKTAIKDDREKKIEGRMAPSLLGSCLANEIQINPDLLIRAIEWYAKNTYRVIDKSITEVILKNKFGNTFRKTVIENFLSNTDDKFMFPLGGILSDIVLIDLRFPDNINDISDEIISRLNKNTKEDNCTALLILMSTAFSLTMPRVNKIEFSINSTDIFNRIMPLLKFKDLHYNFLICWCLAWSINAKIFPESNRWQFLKFLLPLWIKKNEYNTQRVISWALSEILLPTIPRNKFSGVQKLKMLVHDLYNKPKNEFDKIVSIYIGTLIGVSWDKEELTKFFNSHLDKHRNLESSESNFSLFAKELDIRLIRKEEKAAKA